MLVFTVCALDQIFSGSERADVLISYRHYNKWPQTQWFLKPPSNIRLHLGRSQMRNQSHWAKIKESTVPLEDLRRESVFLPFSASSGSLFSLALGPFFRFFSKSLQFCLHHRVIPAPLVSLNLPLPSSYKEPSDYIGLPDNLE